MILISTSALATLGLTIISSGIKYFSSDTLGGAALDSFDNLFSGVLGNVAHERFNQLRDKLEASARGKQNGDIERCSRDALLEALISFSQAATQQLDKLDFEEQDRSDCLHFLLASQKHFVRQLNNLANISDSDPILHRNPLSQSDALSIILAKDNQQRIDTMKEILTDFALFEFGYKSENILHKQLKNWLPQGLPSGQHWFVYYIHAFHANLKKDIPQYCRNARRILTQKQLADITLMTGENLSRLDGLMRLSTEVHQAVQTIREQVSSLEAQNDVIIGQNEHLIGQIEALGIDLQQVRSQQTNNQTGQSVSIASLSLNERYRNLIEQLQAKNQEMVEGEEELEFLREDLIIHQDHIARLQLIQQRVVRAERSILQVDAKRRDIQNELADFVQNVLEIAKKLSPVGYKDSGLLSQAKERFDIGDYEGANAILNETIINQMVLEADELVQRSQVIKQQAAQAFLAKAEFVKAVKKDNWFEESIRFCYKAVDIDSGYDTLASAAYFLRMQNQFSGAIQLYKHALTLNLDEEKKAYIANNLGTSLYLFPEKFEEAGYYYEVALQIHLKHEYEKPGSSQIDIAMIFHNLGYLLIDIDRPKAYECLQKALAIREELEKLDPGRFLHKVAETLGVLGFLESKDLLKQQQAKQYYERALVIRRKLVKKDSSFKGALAHNINTLLILLIQTRSELDRAKLLGQECLQIRSELAQENPTVNLSSLAAIYNDIGMLEALQFEGHGRAIENYETAIKYYNDLYELYPSIYTEFLGNVYNNIANLIRDRILSHKAGLAHIFEDEQQVISEYNLANKYYIKSIEYVRQYLENSPAIYKDKLAGILVNRALLLCYLPQNRKIINELYKEAIIILEQLEQSLPGAHIVQLATTLSGYASYLTEEGESNQTIEQFEKSIKYWEKVVKSGATQYEYNYWFTQSLFSEFLFSINVINNESIYFAEETHSNLLRLSNAYPMHVNFLETFKELIDLAKNKLTTITDS